MPSLPTPHRQSRRPFALHDGGRELDVTVSLGVATHPHHGDSLTALLTAVDTALYRAKRAGKNRVEIAGNERTTEAIEQR